MSGGLAMRWLQRLLLPAGLLLAPPGLRAADMQLAGLAELSLEQLRDVVVTSVSRTSEPLAGVPASVWVIGADDIRRSGATTLPEVLRLVPTLDVARADTNQYAISARGFNNVLANKMLVMIDGRSVYSPLFSGVFWELQDVLLEDVERIEVISGPSTAQWGTNAVNGLIHIITKEAAQTQGTLLSAHVGTRDRGLGARIGGRLGDAGHWRAYAKLDTRSDSELADGRSVGDASRHRQLGFRADWAWGDDRLGLQGDVVEAPVDQPPLGGVDRRRSRGVNLLGHWQRRLAGDAQLSVQGYVERTERDQGNFRERLDTVDVVAQYELAPLAGHRLLLGAGHRASRDRTQADASLALLPPTRDLAWSRLFAQDQIALHRTLTLTLAASLEHNPYTGTESLPSARLAWQPAEGAMFWASAARAVRAPSRVDREFFMPARPLPNGRYLLAGGPDFQAEVSRVYELGHRGQPLASLDYSLTVFEPRHDHLRSLAPTPLGLQFRNDIGGSTRGVEASANWHVLPHWRLTGGGVALRQRLAVEPGRIDVGGLTALGNDPHGWWQLRSSVDLSSQLSWELQWRHVGRRPLPQVEAYGALDTRLGWRISSSAELWLSLFNLLDDAHVEWNTQVVSRRAALLQLRLALPR